MELPAGYLASGDALLGSLALMPSLTPSALLSFTAQLHSYARQSLHGPTLLLQHGGELNVLDVLVSKAVAADCKELFELISLLVTATGTPKSSYTKLLNYITSSQLYTDELLNALRVVSLLLAPSQPSRPSSFFYFDGAGSGIYVPPTEQAPFARGLACLFWLRVEAHAEACLFQAGEGVKYVLQEGRLCFASGQTFKALAVVPLKQWVCVGISQATRSSGRLKVKVLINSEEVCSAVVEGPTTKAHSDVTLFAGFCGQVTTALLYAESVPLPKLKAMHSAYQVGPEGHTGLSNFEQLASGGHKLWLMYHPLHSTDTTVFDLAQEGRHGRFTGISGASVFSSNRVRELGGYAGLLALLEVVSRQETDQASQLLEWLMILEMSLNECPENQLEACARRIVPAMAHAFSHFSAEVFTTAHIRLLARISRFVMPQLKQQLAVDLLWELGFLTNGEVQAEAMAALNNLYREGPKSLSRQFSVRQILQRVHAQPLQSYTAIINIFEGIFDATACATDVEPIAQALTSEFPIAFKELLLGFVQQLLTTRAVPAPAQVCKHFVASCGREALLSLITTAHSASIIALSLKCLELTYAFPVKYPALPPLAELKAWAASKLVAQPTPKFKCVDLSLGDFGSPKESQVSSVVEVKPPPAPSAKKKISFSFNDEEPQRRTKQRVLSFEEVVSEAVSEEVPSERLSKTEKKPIKFFGKSRKVVAAKLSIDTESINANYTCGGEHGEKANAEDELLSEVRALARECVEHMQGLRVTSQQAYPMPPRPLSVKGRKIIEFTDEKPVDEAILEEDSVDEASYRTAEPVVVGPYTVEEVPNLVSELQTTTGSSLDKALADFLLLVTQCPEQAQVFGLNKVWMHWIVRVCELPRAQQSALILHTAVVKECLIYHERGWHALELTLDGAAQILKVPATLQKLLESLADGLGEVTLAQYALWNNLLVGTCLIQQFQETGLWQKLDLSSFISLATPQQSSNAFSIRTPESLDAEACVMIKDNAKRMRAQAYLQCGKQLAGSTETSCHVLDCQYAPSLRKLTRNALPAKAKKPRSLKLLSSHNSCASPLTATTADENCVVSVAAARLKPFVAVPGTLQVILAKQRKALRFTYNMDISVLAAALCEYSLPMSKPYASVWEIDGICTVVPRRHLGDLRAVEILCVSGKCLSFVFVSEAECTTFLKEVKAVNLKITVSNQPDEALTKQWINSQISNFEYLLHLNLVAGRSYNDYTQYPVLPWALTEYETEDSRVFNTFNKVAPYNEEESLSLLQSLHPALLGDSEKPSLGSLHRQTSLCVPELYTCPEALSSFKLPKWAKNAYAFVLLHHQALESEAVSAQLHRWIDQVFGSQNSVLLDTPQLFNSPHPPRASAKPNSRVLVSPTAELKVYLPTAKRSVAPALSSPNPRGIVKAKLYGSSELLAVRLNGSLAKYTWHPGPIRDSRFPFACSHTKEVQLPSVSHLHLKDQSLGVAPVAFVNHKVVEGGFADGRIVVRDAHTKTQTHRKHSQAVTCIAVDEQAQFAVTGSKGHDVVVWRTSEEGWRPLWHHHDHAAAVNSVALDAGLRTYASCSADGTVNLYALWNGKRLRSIQLPSAGQTVLFAAAPPSKLIVFVTGSLCSYTLNGHPLYKSSERCASVVSPVVVKGPQCREFLVYGTEAGELVVRNADTLENYRRFSGPSSISSIVVTPDLKFLIGGCADGELMVFTDPAASDVSNKT